MNETEDKRENEQESEAESGGKKSSRFSKILIAAAAALFSGAGATVVGILLQAAIDRIPSPPPADPGTAVSETGKLSMSRNSFLRAIESASGEECVYDYYGFFDDDAECEMYALVGTVTNEEDESYFTGRLWFANTDGAQEVLSEPLNYFPFPYVVTLKGRQFLALDEYYRTERTTYLWGVYEGQPYETNLSGRGSGFVRSEEFDELEVWEHAYDQSFYYAGSEDNPDDREAAYLGSSWKSYYFDFDGRNFKEYGGIPISIEDVERLPGAELVLNYVDQSQIQSVFYRDNGILNINLLEETDEGGDLYHLNLRYRDGKLGIITADYEDNLQPNQVIWDLNRFQEDPEQFLGFGNYAKALFPDIAVYPTSFPY